jgi:ABC-type branched-subunit amino acid transport system substrate-binding protein
VGAKSIGVVAYGVPQSAAACQAAVTGFRSFGLNVTFTDLNLVYGADPTPSVLQMKNEGVDFLLSCLDLNGNVAFARAVSQNGLTMHQLWLDGYDRGTLHQYGSIMSGVYFGVQHVPFEAASAFPGVYPGMENYIREMQRYEPSSTYDEVALDGWVSAALFVSGLKAVGRDVTQQKLVAAINKETAFTGGGLSPPVNWTTAHSTAKSGKPPYCGAGVQVVNSQFVPRVVPNTNQVFVCFAPRSTTPIPPLPGTPGS